MNSQAFSEWLTWLASLSVSEKIKASALVYSWLTVCTRELFLADTQKGKEKVIINMLHGVNELHHTLANQFGAFAYDDEKHYPLDSFGEQLLEIASQYRIEGLLTSAVEFARAHRPAQSETKGD